MSKNILHSTVDTLNRINCCSRQPVIKTEESGENDSNQSDKIQTDQSAAENQSHDQKADNDRFNACQAHCTCTLINCTIWIFFSVVSS